jgi:CDP-diacylglycerol--glycerol-3-phosphate 3-phosphatidyltransferase
MSSHDFLKSRVQERFDPLIDFFAKHQVSANQLTTLGLVLNIVSTPFIVIGWLSTGGWIFVCGSLLDAMDGPLARSTGSESKLGSMLDSCADRINEGVVLIAIMAHLAMAADVIAVVLCGITLLMSQMTSYIRVLGESKGVDCTVGLCTRVDRVIVLSIGLVFELLVPCLVILALACTVTTAQRFLHVHRALKTRSASP